MSHPTTSADPFVFLFAAPLIDPLVSAFVRAALEDGRSDPFFAAVRTYAGTLHANEVSTPVILRSLEDVLATGHRRLDGVGAVADRRAKGITLSRQALAAAERAVLRAAQEPDGPPGRPEPVVGSISQRVA